MKRDPRIRFPTLAGRGLSFTEAQVLVDWFGITRTLRAQELGPRIGQALADAAGEDVAFELDADDVAALCGVLDGADTEGLPELRLLQQACRRAHDDSESDLGPKSPL